MQQRRYTYSLSGLGMPVKCTSVNVSFALADGFPTVSASVTGTEEIAAIVDSYNAGALLNKQVSLTISISGIRDAVSVTDLIVTRAAPQENVSGYMASLSLMPKAAAFAAAYPGNFISSNYRLTVRGLVSAIVGEFNARFGGAIRGILYEAVKDPISLVAPRFVQMPYLDMIKEATSRHGLMTFIDFNSRLRVFVPTQKSSTSVKINKHHIIESSLILDAMQNLVG